MSSGAADSAVGMMDPAYFTSKKDLLEFFNDLLDLNLTKIEDTASGAMACQLTSLIFPGSLPLSRIDWGARSDYEFIQNYKLLQAAFAKHHVQRYIDVDKLIRAKYQDNLEWCQWLKAFYEQSGSVPGPEYNPSAVREKGKGGKLYNAKMGRRRPRPAAGSHSGGTAASAPKTTSTRSTAGTTTTAAAATAAVDTHRRPSRPLRERAANPAAPPVVVGASPTTATSTRTLGVDPNEPDNNKQQPQQNSTTTNAVELAQLVAENKGLKNQVQELTLETELLDSKNSELTAQVEDLELAVLETESERNYYFEKLRHIEVLLQVFQDRGGCQPPHHNPGTTSSSSIDKLVDDVFKILYATQQDNLVVNEDGEVVEQVEAVETTDVEDGRMTMGNHPEYDIMDNEIDELLSDDV